MAATALTSMRINTATPDEQLKEANRNCVVLDHFTKCQQNLRKSAPIGACMWCCSRARSMLASTQQNTVFSTGA